MATVKWMKEYLIKFRYTMGRTITHGSAIVRSNSAAEAVEELKASKEGFYLEDVHRI